MKLISYLLAFILLFSVSPVKSQEDPKHKFSSYDVSEQLYLILITIADKPPEDRAKISWVFACIIDYQISAETLLTDPGWEKLPKEIIENCMATYKTATEEEPKLITRTPYQTDNLNSLLILALYNNTNSSLLKKFKRNDKVSKTASCIVDFLRAYGPEVAETATFRCILKYRPERLNETTIEFPKGRYVY